MKKSTAAVLSTAHKKPATEPADQRCDDNLLRKNRNVMVYIADPLGNIRIFRMNHPHPPFNDVRARRAVLMALSQEDYMRAAVGNDDSLWKPMPSYFTPGAPALHRKGRRNPQRSANFHAAKRLLAETGYAGQPVTCLMAQDIPVIKARGEATSDLLKHLGMKARGDFCGMRANRVPESCATRSAVGTCSSCRVMAQSTSVRRN